MSLVHLLRNTSILAKRFIFKLVIVVLVGFLVFRSLLVWLDLSDLDWLLAWIKFSLLLQLFEFLLLLILLLLSFHEFPLEVLLVLSFFLFSGCLLGINRIVWIACLTNHLSLLDLKDFVLDWDHWLKLRWLNFIGSLFNSNRSGLRNIIKHVVLLLRHLLLWYQWLFQWRLHWWLVDLLNLLNLLDCLLLILNLNVHLGWLSDFLFRPFPVHFLINLLNLCQLFLNVDWNLRAMSHWWLFLILAFIFIRTLVLERGNWLVVFGNVVFQGVILIITFHYIVHHHSVPPASLTSLNLVLHLQTPGHLWLHLVVPLRTVSDLVLHLCSLFNVLHWLLNNHWLLKQRHIIIVFLHLSQGLQVLFLSNSLHFCLLWRIHEQSRPDSTVSSVRTIRFLG